MALTIEEIEEIRAYLDHSFRPLFFFDDDPDGLSSFLLLYRYKKEGKGVVVKSSPELKTDYLKVVHEYVPDVIFILDKPLVSQEFLDSIHVPIIWVDHHTPVKRNNVRYYNPHLHDPADSRPVSYWSYKIVNNPKDIWIGTAGCLGDWFIPEFIEEFSKKYPEMLNRPLERPDEILFGTMLGRFVQMLSFLLKGKKSIVDKNIKVLTRIESPYEILQQTTPRGKFLYRNYEPIKKNYDLLLEKAKKDILNKPEEEIIVFKYKDKHHSFTSDLSNELLYLFKNKVIVVGREKNGEIKCSIRSSQKPIREAVHKALKNIRGYGGGHNFACGASMVIEDFDDFVNNLKDAIKKESILT